MPARILFGLILVWPMFACAAEPDRQSDAEPSSNVTVRVRVVEVSLTKLNNMGVSWVTKLDGNASQVDRRLELWIQKSVARVIKDEAITVAVGAEARVHAGTEFMPDSSSKADTRDGEVVFDGTDLVLATRSQEHGKLLMELLCRQFNPIILRDKPPQRRVHEIATVVELAEDEAIVLKGEKEKRVEASVTGVFPHVPGFRRVTHTYNEIQTFVIVSREPRLADETAAVVEMQDQE